MNNTPTYYRGSAATDVRQKLLGDVNGAGPFIIWRFIMSDKLIPINGKAVLTYKLNHILTESVEITIKDGLVVGVEHLTNGGDTLTAALIRAERAMAISARTNPVVSRSRASEAVEQAVKQVQKGKGK